MSDFATQQKKVRLLLKEIEEAILVDEPEITEEELKSVMKLAKERILTEMGILDWYLEQERNIKEWSKNKKKETRDEITKEIQEAKDEMINAIPPEKEIPTPQIINKTEIVKEIVKEVVKPTIIEKRYHTTEIKEKLNTEPLNELQDDLNYLQTEFTSLYDKVNSIPKPIDYSSQIKDLADNQSILKSEMPNWRALGIGLRGDIDKLRTDFDNFSASENLWDRTGTNLTPHTAGDSISLGTGNITANNLAITNWNTAYSWGNHASAGYALASNVATKALDNLASVAINTSLISDTDSTDNLGSTTIAWANLYVDTIRSITGNALNLTPIAGQNLNVNLSTTGDFVVNTNQLYVDTSAGNVGFGTTSPSAKLHSLATTEQLRLGYDTANYASFTVDSTGILTISPTLYTKHTKRFVVDYDSTGAATQNALTFYHDVTPASSSGFTMRGIQGFTRSYGTQNITGTIQGFQGGTIHNSTGTLASAIGGDFYCYSAGSCGTTTSAKAVQAQLYTEATRIITSGYSIFLATPTNSGTLTNTYGLYIASQTNGTQTNTPFSVYQAGTADRNYFAGNVGIGTTNPGMKLVIGADNAKLGFGTGEDASIYYDGTNLIINPKEVGTGYLNIKGQVLVDDKIIFTQTDGNEYIDSLNDGYLDLGATTGIRLKQDTTLDANMDLVLSGTGYVDSPKYYAGGTAPVADATYPIYNDGVTSGQVTSITTKGGIITAIAVIP